MEIINDRYEVRKEIRRGGFGVTWYAWDTKLDMPVAIKEFSDPNPESRDKFLREARTLAKFSGQRGIVNVRDYLQTKDKVYMVMEFLDGEDLSAYVDSKGRLSFEETMRLLHPVMDVLKKLHAANMLHRDVSPDNIRLTSDGEVKLLDFGSVSNMANDDVTKTVTVKAGYAPIEQYSGAEQQGPWSDVYSLCATIYKCITGKKPKDSLARSFQDDVERPLALGAKISEKEDAVLMKGFSVRPQDRYQSIDEFDEALKAAKINPGQSAGNKDMSDLASKAFSDESTPKTADVEPAANPVRPKPVKNKRSKDTVSAGGEKADSPSEDSKKSRSKMIIPIALVAALVIGAAVFFMTRGGSSGGSIASGSGSVDYEKGSNSIDFKEKTITDEDIDFIKENEAITYLYFSKCQLSNEIIKRMPELTNVKYIRIYASEGYTSLDALADMPALEEIAIWEAMGKAFPGDQLFTREFPEHVVSFELECDELDGSTAFLWNFPGLTELNFCVDKDGNDMAFLESMPKLQDLYIAYQTMDEVNCRHLKGHPDLWRAKFYETGLVTIEWASECVYLNELSAEGCSVTDLSPLADHENLETVELSGASVSDLTPLENCKNLLVLKISHSNVESLAGLTDHEKLLILDISYCQVSDLSPLSNTSLTRLNAEHNKISTLEPLSSCTDMEDINVNGNELENLEGCQDMIKLESFQAANNHITDISGLHNSTLLKNLQLSNNEISDISALDNDFKNLKVIDISGNSISDISVLKACVELNAVVADHNKIASIEGLGEKKKLAAVLLSDNELTDISLLGTSMDSLSYLDIGNNNIADISVLKNLSVKNVWLLMENNNIKDISMVPPLLNYKDIIVYGNQIKDISFVDGMKNASYNCKLYISYQEGMDFAAIGRSKFNSNTGLVDVPSDKKASVLQSFKEDNFYEPEFMTSEEADKQMVEKRKEIKREVLGDLGADEEDTTEQE